MKLINFAIPIVLSLVLASLSPAEEASIDASVDRKTVSVGDTIIFTIYVSSVQAIPAPELPVMDGFQSQYIGPRTQISLINGQSRVSVDHRYYLTALKEGTFTIPSIAIRYSERLYQTNPIEIQVTPASASPQREAMTAEELQRYIRLDIATKKDTAYVNEGVPLLIRLYIRSGIEVENISRLPRFSAPGISMIPFGNPVQRQTTISGIRFITVDFSTTAYPVKSGQLTLGPAEMDCRVVVRPSRSHYRGARYEMTVKSDPHVITVKPIPAAGKPANFSGAVGQYSLDVEAKPLSLKVGEPITLTMTVRGVGNIDTAGIPEIMDLTGFKAYDPQISVDKTGNTGIKTFEQVLIPASSDIVAIPEIRFSYFDPDEGQYKTETRGPIRIQVAPSDKSRPLEIFEVAGGKTVKREVLGQDIVYIKDEIGDVSRRDKRLYKNKGFLLLQLLPLAGFAGVLVYQKRRERFATDRTYARQYHAPRKAKRGLAQAQELIAAGQPQEFCSAIFRTMQEYLGDRFNLPSAGITIEIVEDLRRGMGDFPHRSQNFTEEVSGKLLAFFQTCDRTRFARSEMSQDEMNEILNLAKDSIRLLEKGKL